MVMQEDAALIARIRAIVMQLPHLEREVFLLHCVSELEYREVAWRLDITVDVVQSALAKALAQIDLELGEYGRSH